MKKIYTKKDLHMLDDYKEIRGFLIKKYRNIWRQYILVFDEAGIKSKVSVNETLYTKAELGTKWTIGHIKGNLINSRPGFCENNDEE